MPRSITRTSSPHYNNRITKIRSPTHAVTDWIYCPEAPGSPRPQAPAFPFFRTKNPVSYYMRGTSLFYFTTFNSINIIIFDLKMGFLVFVRRLSPTILSVFICTVVFAVVRAVLPLGFIYWCSYAIKLILWEILGYF